MLKILIFFIDIFALINGWYDCTKNTTVKLNLNELSFFGTPNYPELVSTDDFYANNLIYFLDKNYTEKAKLVLLFTYLSGGGGSDFIQNYADFRVLQLSSYSIQSYPRLHITHIRALQGFVLFENFESDECPLESISKKVPFQFTDDRQTIYIQSGYINQSNIETYKNQNYTRKTACQWKFKAPVGYGLKVIFLTLNLNTETHLTVVNSTYILANERSAKTYRPYYSVDEYIEINLSKSNSIVFDNLELQASINIYKLNVPKTEIDCPVKKLINNLVNTTYWYSPNYLSTGYKSNIRCNYNFTIKPKTEIYVFVSQQSLEKGADIIKFHHENEEDDFMALGTIFLQPYRNGTKRNVYFSFESDGSIESSGFLISFREIICQCSDPIVLCDSGYHTIINQTDFVCQYMHCYFYVMPCNTTWTYLQIDINKEEDIFKVYSNNITVFDSNVVQSFKSTYSVFLNSKNNNYIEISTNYSKNGMIGFYVTKTDFPSIDVWVTLSPETPYFLVDLSLMSLAVFQISPILNKENTSVTIYSNYPQLLSLYNNESLSISIAPKNCKFKCYLNVEKFAINEKPPIEEKSNYNFHYFLASLSKPPNCVFGETIFYLGDTQVISAVSTDQGDCDIWVFQNAYYYISSLWTNSKNDTVKIYVGTNQSKLLLEFNSTSATNWNKIWLMSLIHTIRVPKNFAVLIKFEKYENIPDLPYFPLHEQIYQKPYHSLVSTFNYGFPSCESSPPNFFTYNIKNATIKFTALNYTVTNGNEFYLNVNETNLHFNKTGDSYIISNQAVTLHFCCSKKNENGVLLFVETIDF